MIFILYMFSLSWLFMAPLSKHDVHCFADYLPPENSVSYQPSKLGRVATRPQQPARNLEWPPPMLIDHPPPKPGVCPNWMDSDLQWDVLAREYKCDIFMFEQWLYVNCWFNMLQLEVRLQKCSQLSFQTVPLRDGPDVYTSNPFLFGNPLSLADIRG